MLPGIASARLDLSAVSDGDIGLMRRLNADEVVMRNLTGRPATAEETYAEWTERLQGRSDPGRGLGYWIGRADGVFVGWWGLGRAHGSQARRIWGIACVRRTGDAVWLPKAAGLCLDMPSTTLG